MIRRKIFRFVVAATVLFGVVLLPTLLGSPAHATTTSACPSGSVALTYDDGPVADRTEVILAALDWVGVKATFFMIGSRVERFPHVAEEVDRRGHAVANHTWDHVDLIGLSDAEVDASIQNTDGALIALGIEPLPLVRPPFLRVNRRVRADIEAAGFLTALPTVNPKDWDDVEVAMIVDRAVNGARDGGVIGLHDGHRPYQKSAVATVGIVEALTERGFCFGVLDASGSVVNGTPATLNDTRSVWADGLLLYWSPAISQWIPWFSPRP